MKNQFKHFFTSSIFFYLLPLFFIVFLTNCNKNDVDPCVGDFNQETLYENMADRVILPAYLSLKNDVDNLRQKVATFEGNPNKNNLNAMQATFTSAWFSWQAVTPFEFGPAKELDLQINLNSFPADANLIEQNINQDNYNLNEDENRFAKGFAALDYLFYGLANNDNEIVQQLNRPAYLLYIYNVVADMKFRTDFVLEEWEDKGYRSEFVKNTGARSESSLDLLVQTFYNNYTIVKEEKLGIPSGITTGNSQVQQVEALYSGISVELAKAAVIAMKKTFKGGTGDGLDDYLVSNKAKKEDRPLNLLIEEQLTAVEVALENVSSPLSQALQQDFSDIEKAYMELEALEETLKVDLPDALCVNL